MRHIAVWMLLVVSACVSEAQGPGGTTAGAGSGSGLICTEEAPTGSTFKRTVCRTPEQVEADRKGADDMMRNQNSRPSFTR